MVYLGRSYFRVLATSCMLTAIASCATYEVRTTDLQPVDRLTVDVPEQLLIDVGLNIFEPDLEDVPSDERVFVNVRESESVWIAQQLKNTLERSNAWGVVRIVPDNQVIMDLSVDGRVLQSDGETLALQVTAVDAAGRTWLDKEYVQVISRYSYDPSQRVVEPFQGLYNDISNDLLTVLMEQPLDYREDLRTIRAIKFAQSFSPEAFEQYLVNDDAGFYQIDRLPLKMTPC